MEDSVSEQKQKREVCGLIMPISASDNVYTEQHWREVKSILEEAIESAGFNANLVSDADDAGIIHNRIVGNLGENPIIVCDVSSKNPNVMFELGLRLAFDKPTIVVKDNITNYSFDTSPIEHVLYPVDLNYHSINTFKNALKAKLKGTWKASKDDPNYSTFLKHFVQYRKKLDEKIVGAEELILKQIEAVNKRLTKIERQGYNYITNDIEVKAFNDLIKNELINFYEKYNIDTESTEDIINNFVNHFKNRYPYFQNIQLAPLVEKLIYNYRNNLNESSVIRPNQNYG